MKSEPSDRKTGILFTSVASLIWGTMFVATGFGLQSTNPYSLVFLRWAVASLLVIAIDIALKGKFGIVKSLSQWPIWVVGGVEAAGFVFQYVGQGLTNASNATLLANLMPVFTPFLALILFKEEIRKSQITAALLGLLGLALVASPQFDSSRAVFGNFLLLSSSIFYALFITLSKKMKVTSLASAFGVIISMSVFLFPVAFVFGGLNFGQIESIGEAGWLSIIYMAIFGGAVSMGLYLKGLGSISSGESSVLLLGEVLTGLILSLIIFREFLTSIQLLGAVILMSAMSLPAFRSANDAQDLRQKLRIGKQLPALWESAEYNSASEGKS